MDKIENYIYSILAPILKYPEKLSIKIKEDQFWILAEVSVFNDDMPKIIWKNWIYLSSLRNIVRTYWFSLNKRINIKILED